MEKIKKALVRPVLLIRLFFHFQFLSDAVFELGTWKGNVHI